MRLLLILVLAGVNVAALLVAVAASAWAECTWVRWTAGIATSPSPCSPWSKER